LKRKRINGPKMNGGDDMKNKLTLSYCLDEECGWEETSHRNMDGIRCPKCGRHVTSEFVKKNPNVR